MKTRRWLTRTRCTASEQQKQSNLGTSNNTNSTVHKRATVINSNHGATKNRCFASSYWRIPDLIYGLEIFLTHRPLPPLSIPQFTAFFCENLTVKKFLPIYETLSLPFSFFYSHTLHLIHCKNSVKNHPARCMK